MGCSECETEEGLCEGCGNCSAHCKCNKTQEGEKPEEASASESVEAPAAESSK
jgi:hypothetical protein